MLFLGLDEIQLRWQSRKGDNTDESPKAESHGNPVLV